MSIPGVNTNFAGLGQDGSRGSQRICRHRERSRPAKHRLVRGVMGLQTQLIGRGQGQLDPTVLILLLLLFLLFAGGGLGL